MWYCEHSFLGLFCHCLFEQEGLIIMSRLCGDGKCFLSDIQRWVTDGMAVVAARLTHNPEWMMWGQLCMWYVMCSYSRLGWWDRCPWWGGRIPVRDVDPGDGGSKRSYWRYILYNFIFALDSAFLVKVSFVYICFFIYYSKCYLFIESLFIINMWNKFYTL